jgi:hypothetical protein
MTAVPFGVPVAWTYCHANDLQSRRSSVEISSDSMRRRRLFR